MGRSLPRLRASELELGGRRFVVFSMPIEARPLGLTDAEADVCVRLVRGGTAAEIGAARGTTERTVGNQIQAIYRKLQVRSRRELVARFMAEAAGPDDADGAPSGVLPIKPPGRRRPRAGGASARGR